MLGKRTKAVAEDADYAIDFNRFRVRANTGGDVDCLLDMMLSNSRRKGDRGVSSWEDFVSNGETFDEHFVAFLLDLEEFVEEDVDDPDYVRFLRDWGSSYVLDEPIDDSVSLPVVRERENIHLVEVMKRKKPRHGRDDYVQIERNIAEKNTRRYVRSCEGNGTHKERTCVRRMKRKKSCSVSTSYVQEERNVGEKYISRNVRSYRVNGTLKERSRGESMPQQQQHYPCTTSSLLRGETMKRENSCFLNDGYVQAKRNVGEKNNRRNVRSCGVNGTQKDITLGESMKKKIFCSPSDGYVQERKNVGEKNNRRIVGSHGVNGTLNGITRGETMKGGKSCFPSDGYVQEEGNVGEKSNRRNMKTRGVNKTQKERTRGESMKRKKSCSSSDGYVQEVKNVGEKNNRGNVISCGVNGTQKERTRGETIKQQHYPSTMSSLLHGETMKGKKPCSPSNGFVQDDRNIGEKNNRRNVRSCGDNGTQKVRTRGETMKKKSCSPSDGYVQEERNIGEKNNKSNVRSCGVIGTMKERIRGESMKRKKSCSPSDDYVQQVRTSNSSEDTISNVMDSGLYNRMAESLNEDVQEKSTVGEIIKRRKLTSDTGNYIQEERNLNGPKSCAESPGFRMTEKENPISLSPDYFQDDQRTEKKNPISLSFDQNQDDPRTKKKNPISLSVDNFKEERSLDVIDHSGSFPKKLKSRTENSREIIPKPLSFDHFQDEQRTEKENPIFLSFDYVQDDKRTEKKNPISLSFDLNQDDQRTKKKNPTSQDDQRTGKKNQISLSVDHFQKEQSLDVIDHSGSAPKKSSLQKTVAYELYDLFLENLKVNGESLVYEFRDIEQVYYDLPSDRSLAIVAESSNPPISIVSDSSNLPISIAAETSNLPLSIAAASSYPPFSIVAKSSKLPVSIAAESSDRSKCKTVARLPSTAPSRDPRLPPLRSIVRVATTKRQSTHPSTSSIPASRPTVLPSDKQLDNNLIVLHRVPPIMRKKLLVIVSQPYNKQEHEQLWNELNFRSPVLSHRDSRSGGSDKPGPMGRSLLDWNPDVQSEIDKVKSDPLKVLNLLRMLKFYIQKQALGRLCKPWMDDSLMASLP